MDEEQKVLQPNKEIPAAKHSQQPNILILLFVALLSGAIFGIVGYTLGMHTQTIKTTALPATLKSPSMIRITPSPTTKVYYVRSYTNPTYNFSFQYPNTVAISKNKSYSDEVVGFIPTNASNNKFPIIDIRSLDNSKNLSIQNFNNQFSNNPYNNNPFWDDLPSAQQTTVGGRKAYFMKNSGDCDPELCDMYVIPLQNKILEIYRITGDPNLTPDSQSQPIFNTIISSFTFTQ